MEETCCDSSTKAFCWPDLEGNDYPVDGGGGMILALEFPSRLFVAFDGEQVDQPRLTSSHNLCGRLVQRTHIIQPYSSAETQSSQGYIFFPH
jgi:hypothetical protein